MTLIVTDVRGGAAASSRDAITYKAVRYKRTAWAWASVGAQKKSTVALRRSSALGEPVVPLPALFRCGDVDDRRLALGICKKKRVRRDE